MEKKNENNNKKIMWERNFHKTRTHNIKWILSLSLPILLSTKECNVWRTVREDRLDMLNNSSLVWTLRLRTPLEFCLFRNFGRLMPTKEFGYFLFFSAQGDEECVWDWRCRLLIKQILYTVYFLWQAFFHYRFSICLQPLSRVVPGSVVPGTGTNIMVASIHTWVYGRRYVDM